MCRQTNLGSEEVLRYPSNRFQNELNVQMQIPLRNHYLKPLKHIKTGHCTVEKEGECAIDLTRLSKRRNITIIH